MNKYINKIISASIFFVPIASVISIHGTIVWYPQLLMLMALGFILLAIMCWEMNKFVSLFLIYATFSYLIICSQSPRSMLCLITGYSGIIFSYFVSKSNGSNIYKYLAFMAGLNVILVVLQVFNIDPIFQSTNGSFIERTVGFMGSRNQLGIFSAGASTLLIIISPWFLFLSVPILLIKCSSAFVGLCVGLNSLLFLKGYKKIATFLLIILLSGSFLWVKFGYKSGEISERLSLWKLTISQSINGKLTSDDGKTTVRTNPLFGYGIGNFFVYSSHSQGIVCGTTQHRYEHAHNDLVEALFEFGYIGLILILLCISKVIADFIECLHLGHPHTNKLIFSFCSLITLCVCSMGVYVFHAPVSLFLFCLFLGIFYREVNHAKQGKIT